MKHEIDWKQIPLTTQIQMLYPEEPDWSEVESDTLVPLVETFVEEPNCASLALGQLRARRHERTIELAWWLLDQEQADEWLKAAAQDTLASIEDRPCDRFVPKGGDRFAQRKQTRWRLPSRARIQTDPELSRVWGHRTALTLDVSVCRGISHMQVL